MTAAAHILHLSDLHFGPGELQDAGFKIHLPGALKHRPAERLSAYIRSLSTPPDFVCITGDIANHGHQSGFERFAEWVEPLIAGGALPARERFLITPGNHDVNWDAQTEDERFEKLRSLALAFPHAHLPGLDPPLSEVSTQTGLDPLVGGLTTQSTALGSSEMVDSKPYILDRDLGVLIFAFNSALGCGVYPEESRRMLAEVRAIEEMLTDQDERARDRLSQLHKTASVLLKVDAGFVGDEQLDYFSHAVNAVKMTLGDDEWARLTKIVIMHHHLTPIWEQQLELKPFESIIDCAQLREALTEWDFDIVLHGHKHKNGVSVDGRVVPTHFERSRSPLGIVSGGTACGTPTVNDKQTFKVVMLEPGPTRRVAAVEEYPLARTRNPAQRMQEDRVVYHLPLAIRIPDLHSDTALKRQLDDMVIDKFLHQQGLSDGSRILARNHTIALNGTSPFVSAEQGMRISVTVDTGEKRQYIDVILATCALGFAHTTRIHWMISNLAHLAESIRADSDFVVLVANLADTHFSCEMVPGEIANSIGRIRHELTPAVSSGVLRIVELQIEQEEFDSIDISPPGGRYRDAQASLRQTDNAPAPVPK